MKKLYKFILLIVTLALTLTAGILIHAIFFKPHVWLTTTSPGRAYTVELTGRRSRSFYHVVRFKLIKNGQAIIRNAHAHSGDWMDTSFELAYPEHAWVSENVLRFWRNPDMREDKFDTLLISNDTDKAIKYLNIHVKDMFLVFDVRPKSSLRLSFSHQPGGSWIDCEGVFEDGQRIVCDGVGFTRNGRPDEPVRYCLSVHDGGVKIGSPQAEGYDSDSDWTKPNVPRAEDCSP